MESHSQKFNLDNLRVRRHVTGFAKDRQSFVVAALVDEPSAEDATMVKPGYFLRIIVARSGD